MLAQMSPYTPSLYQPGSYGRYRQYPRQVTTPVPGAGYDVGQMVWAEQELNLDGSSQPQHYGDYAQVPLRGLGLSLPTLSPTLRASLMPQLNIGGGSQGGPAAIETPPEQDVARLYEAPPPVPPEVAPSFFERKVGPVPVWAIGAGGLAAAAGGLGWWWLRRRKR